MKIQLIQIELNYVQILKNNLNFIQIDSILFNLKVIICCWLNWFNSKLNFNCILNIIIKLISNSKIWDPHNSYPTKSEYFQIWHDIKMPNTGFPYQNIPFKSEHLTIHLNQSIPTSDEILARYELAWQQSRYRG